MPRHFAAAAAAAACIALAVGFLSACAQAPVNSAGSLTASSAPPTAAPGVTSPVTATAAPTSTTGHHAGGASGGGGGTTSTHTATTSPSPSTSPSQIRDYGVYWDRDSCQMARDSVGDASLAMPFEIKYRGPGAASDTSAYWSDAEGGNGVLDSGTLDEPTSKWTTDTDPQTVTALSTLNILAADLSKYEGMTLTLTITIHPADPDTDGYDDQAVEYVKVPDATDLPPDDSTLHYITCQ